MSTEIDIDELERLARAATPGSWQWHKTGTNWCLRALDAMSSYVLDAIHERYQATFRTRTRNANGLEVMGPLNPADPDAAYIAAADQTTVLALIERVRDAEKRAEQDGEYLTNARNMVDGTPEGRAVLYAAMLRGWSAEDMQSFGVMLVNRGKPNPDRPPMKLNVNPDWLLQIAEKEDTRIADASKPDPADDTPRLPGGPYRVYTRSVSGWGVIGAQGRIAGFYDDPQSAQRAADEMNGVETGI